MKEVQVDLSRPRCHMSGTALVIADSPKNHYPLPETLQGQEDNVVLH